MKVFILFSLLVLKSQAALKTISTDFWSSSYEDNQLLTLKPVDESLTDDCARYSEFAFDENNYLRGMTAEELDNARTLPVAGKMKDFYQADFLVQFADMKISDQTMLSVNTATLDGIRAASPGRLVALSEEFGLSKTTAELHREDGQISIHIRARDLACDLLQKNIRLQATARYSVGLTAQAILQLNLFYQQVEKQTLGVLALPGTELQKAAMLGFRYSLLFPGSSPEKIQEKISMLFRQLFIPGSLTLNENWVELGGKKIISITKEKQTGPEPVSIGVP